MSDGDFPDPPAGELNVTMLDVGQGECVGIETREHHVYLVDAGSTSKKKTGQYQIIPWLKYIGTRSVEGIFITHWDEDHISAVGELLEWSESSRVKIRRIFLPDVALKDEAETLLQQIEEAEVSAEYLSAGEHMTDGALQISCLHPMRKSAGGSHDASLVLRLSQGDFQMLLTGDLEKSGEDWLAEQARPAGADPARCAGAGTPVCTVNPARWAGAGTFARTVKPARCAKFLRCTILDAGHHGASNATGEALLDRHGRSWSCFCGKNNRYGHPAPETLERLEERESAGIPRRRSARYRCMLERKKVKIETSTSFSK
ncbi:MAG: ComEC/Rec2 family competence protein [Gallintestinimicrobium sp.]